MRSTPPVREVGRQLAPAARGRPLAARLPVTWLLLGWCVLAAGCATCRHSSGIARPFDFSRDTFAYPNELKWVYRHDPVTGRQTTEKRSPPPDYALRCFVLARAARQFRFHAEFEPRRPVADAATYRALIREVVRRSPRCPSAATDRVVITGYSGLRDFSHANEVLLKAECGSAIESYLLRSHWRMVFPFSRASQAATAQRLLERLAQGHLPIVHVLRFPQLSINHGLLLYAAAETASQLDFSAYDPNNEAQPVQLTYDRQTRTFLLAPTAYWGGGRVDVYEIYRGWPY